MNWCILSVAIKCVVFALLVGNEAEPNVLRVAGMSNPPPKYEAFWALDANPVFKANNGPNTNARRDHAEGSHDPLSERVFPYEKGLPLKEGLIRLACFFGLAFPVMIFAATFGTRDRALRTWRFYGWLFGGFFVWILSGVLILGWPLLSVYGALPFGW